MSEKRFGSIDGQELYRRLATGESVALIDVRTDSEFEDRHIPGSVLIPLHELPGRITEVPNSGTPVAVICEVGQRSAAACGLLAEHGYRPLFNLVGGIHDWPGPLEGRTVNGNLHAKVAPSSWLVENFNLLPRGLVLDIAMGAGRNGIYLAARGFDVDGVDCNSQAVARARAAARRLGAPIRAVVGNFEDGTHIIPLEAYDVIVCFNYLHRPLFKDIRDGLRPGGVVVYQTYTTEQAQFGRPTNPAHLLEPGELKEVFADFDLLRYREFIGASRGNELRAVASIVARRPQD